MTDYSTMTADEKFRLLEANTLGFELFGLQVDPELVLISKVLETEDIKSCIHSGIKVDWFRNIDGKPPYRDIWEWMVSYYDQHGASPTVHSYSLKFGPAGFQDLSTEPYGAIIQHFREISRKRLASDALNKAHDTLKGGDVDADKVVKIFEEYVEKDFSFRGLAPRSTSLFLPKEDINSQIDDLRANAGKMIGIPCGYVGLDSLNRGFRPQQLITIVGEKKRGKSFLTLWMAMQIYQAFDYTPAYVSLEMSDDEIRKRYIAMAAGINLTDFLNGDFSAAEAQRAKAVMNDHDRKHGFILNFDRSRTRTVEDIGRMVESAIPRPDILFVDGAYLLQDHVSSRRDASPTEKLMKITQGFKELAQDLNIPIVITTQAAVHKLGSTKELDEDSAAWSSSYGQDSDLMLSFYRDHENPDHSFLKIALARAHASGRKIRLNWQFTPRIDFSQIDYEEDRTANIQLGGTNYEDY